MKLVLILIAGVMAAACASSGPAADADKLPTVAAAEPETQQRAAPGKTPAEDPDYWNEEICKREPVTGTRLTIARCHTRYDWARMSSAATETMREIQDRPIPCLDGAGCGGPGD